MGQAALKDAVTGAKVVALPAAAAVVALPQATGKPLREKLAPLAKSVLVTLV
eukprot:gene9362-12024_t